MRRDTFVRYRVVPIHDRSDPLWGTIHWDKDTGQWLDYSDYLDFNYCFERECLTAKKARGLRDYLLQNKERLKLSHVRVYRIVYYTNSLGYTRTLSMSGWAYDNRNQKSLLKRKVHY